MRLSKLREKSESVVTSQIEIVRIERDRHPQVHKKWMKKSGVLCAIATLVSVQILKGKPETELVKKIKRNLERGRMEFSPSISWSAGNYDGTKNEDLFLVVGWEYKLAVGVMKPREEGKWEYMKMAEVRE